MVLQKKFHLGNVHLVCQVSPALTATFSIIFSYLFMEAIQQACKQAGQPNRGAQSPQEGNFIGLVMMCPTFHI